MEKIIGLIVITLVIVAGAYAASALVTMLLWNWVIVDVFSAPTVSYLTAFGLTLVWSWVTLGESIWHQQVLSNLKKIANK